MKVFNNCIMKINKKIIIVCYIEINPNNKLIIVSISNNSK